ncbi:MAG: DUF748 domain-containing protein [Gammaproteobacteria bacterium]|nr:DUF748 domain-containing protein [Gammaproteobacteria bacterium]
MIRKLKLPALIAAGLILLYAAAGFLLVPAVARSQATDILQENYRLGLEIGKLRFNPFTFTARLERVSLSAPDGSRLLAFDAFSADFELRSLLERALVFKSFALTRPYVHIHLRADGTVNLIDAFAGAAGQEAAGEEPGAAPPAVLIGDLALTGGDLHFTDDSQGRAFDEHFTPLELRVQHLSTRPEDRTDLVGLGIAIGEHGRLTVAGDLSAIPTRFDVKLAAQDIPLATFQPYLAGRLPAEIGDGKLSFELSLSHGQAGQDSRLAVTGSAVIASLAVRLKDRDDVVLAWDEVKATGIRLDLAPDRLAVDEVAVAGLDTAFRIYADGRTNIGEAVRQAHGGPPEEAEPPAHPDPAEPVAPDGAAFPYAIGRVAVSASGLLFSDEQIRPNVRVRIEDLAGEIRDIGSDTATSTTIALTGRVGEYGKAEIGGAARLAAPKQDLEAKVAFNNIELTSFSPYAGKFAGYTIDKGKLFLDLRYTLADGRIKGGNHAVFDQFELGTRVESEDATSLPVRFALSLLRDREGRIEIDLPVEGDVDDPGFRLGPLIVKALVNLVTRIVTAPFSFIADMFGGGPDMEYALYDAGSGVLSAAERDKILPLSKALAARPRLVVEIQGWADPGGDGDAMRQARLDALLAAAAPDAAQQESSEDRVVPLSPSAAVLASAYDAFFGAGAAEALRVELAAAAGGNGDGSENPSPTSDPGTGDRFTDLSPSPNAAAGTADPAADMAAFEAGLRARLLAAQPVAEEELAALAYTRGQQVMDLLVQEGGIAAERIFVRRGELATEGEGTRAKLILDAR